MDEKELYAQCSDDERAMLTDARCIPDLCTLTLKGLRHAIRATYPQVSESFELATAQMVIQRLARAFDTALQVSKQ